MNIGIITFHAAHNYGSMLQAYAMQTFLERQGHHVEIVNFRPLSQKRGYPKPIDFATMATMKQSVKRICVAPQTIKPLNERWRLFEKFLNEKLNTTKEYTALAELKKASFNFDAIITGSDQIWNTNAFDFSEAYFATFASKGTCKIAYAPSMGPNPENQNAEYLKNLLGGYKAISVREERTKEFLVNNHIADHVKVVLDPTMLLDESDYESIVGKEPIIDGKYIYYYTPGSVRHEFLDEAVQMGKAMGLPVVFDNTYYPYQIRNCNNLIPYVNAGPSEFLNLIKNATMVCGASFHLMAFSILFKKTFYCMNGDVDSRMNNLMNMLNLEDRIWSVKHHKSFNFSKIKSYNQVYEILKSKRKDSVDFINGALN